MYYDNLVDDFVIYNIKVQSNRLKKLFKKIENEKRWKNNYNLYYSKLKDIEKDIKKVFKKINKIKK
ncbi:MAG: hypothetical protein NC925_04540 [Candidatus Omnitrophica bacterium]|nr:hypothetical protein [Candidatus Omnitrophota bacterium]MCM8831679.1 hypothetical protein [Candidatus Omnitrophota bacterium]